MRRAWVAMVPLAGLLAACGGGGTQSGPRPSVAGSPSPHPRSSAGSRLVVPVAAGGSADAGAACTPDHFRLESLSTARAQAGRILRRMTLPEEISLLHGVGMNGGSAETVGATRPLPRLGVPSVNQEDGPGGVGDSDTGVTQLPAPIALAATFDPAAARCYGQVIGQQARAKGIQLIYGPTVNLVRLPQWGRAFESYGEDPYLSGTIGAADITGMQRAGVMAEAKHFAVYNQETFRNLPADDAIVAERTLQETYLKVWRLVTAAQPAAIMCSYSTINGVDACQNRSLIHDFLDRGLHYPGFVGADYGATHSTVAAVKAGLDQEMPASIYFGKPLLGAVRSGRVSRTVVDQAATRILTQMYRFRLFTDYAAAHPQRNVDSAADVRVSTAVAEQATVLLKDSSGVLPLSGAVPIAVIGPAATAATTTVGGGSATVLAPSVVTPLAGVRAAAAKGEAVSYSAGLPTADQLVTIPTSALQPSYPPSGAGHSFVATLTAPETGTYIIGMTAAGAYLPISLDLDGVALLTNPAAPPVGDYTAAAHLTAGQTYRLSTTGGTTALRWATPSQISPDLSAAVTAAARAAVAVVVVADPQESEGGDRATLTLPSAQDELVSAVAAANPHTVVVVQAGAAVTMPWLSHVAGVVDQWYAGQTAGTALAAVLFGAANPSGHLPVTFPRSLTQTPVTTARQFPGVGGKVRYSEGDNIGYRWWIDTGHRPLFPFGFGLSYTSFYYGRPLVRVETSRDGAPVVSVREKVVNTGHRSGADVAQVYLGLPGSAGEPDRQLEAYRRVGLRAGKTAVVVFTLRGLQLAAYLGGHWQIPAGRYRVWVGDSSATAQLTGPVPFHLTAEPHAGRP